MVPLFTQVPEVPAVGRAGPTVLRADRPAGCGSKPWRTAACRPAPSRWPRATIPFWSASASPGPPRPPTVGATPVYQFSAAPHGGAFHVVRDFSPANAFTWTPMQEGNYDIQVTVKDGYQATETTSAVVADEVASRVTGSQAVVTPTAQPARGPVQRPALVGGDGVRPVRRGGRQPGLAEHRRSGRRAGEEHQLLRGGHAAEHDLPDAARVQRRHRLRARALHDREPCPRR